MLPTTHLLAFALTAFVLIVIPGPSVLFTIGRALTVGRRGALLRVCGNASACTCRSSPSHSGSARSCSVGRGLHGVKLAGAAYLIYLGVQAFRHRQALARHGNTAPVRRRGGSSSTASWSA